MFRINIDRKLVKDQALLKELEKPDNGETLLEGVTSGISELLN